MSHPTDRKLREKDERILIEIYDHHPASCLQSEISESLDFSPSTISRAISRLEENGYISIDRSGRSNILELKNPGIFHMKRRGGHVPKTCKGCNEKHCSEEHNYSGRIRIHNCTIFFPIEEGLDRDRDIERFFKQEFERHRYIEDSDEWHGWIEDRHVRATSHGIYIRMEDILGEPDQSAEDLKGEILLRAFRMMDWIESNSDFNIERIDRVPESIELEVAEEHIASMRNAFTDYCSRHDISDFSVESEMGREYFIDESMGEPELECELRDRAERNIDRFEELMRMLALGDFDPEDLADISDILERIERLERLGDDIQDALRILLASMFDDGRGHGEGRSGRGEKKEEAEKKYYDREMREAMDRAGI